MPTTSTKITDLPLQGTAEEFQDLCDQVAELTIEEAREELLDAARHGEADVVRALLQAFDVVDTSDQEQSTALHKASANGHVDCVQLLLLFDAQHRPNASGNTPLHWAAANGHAHVVQRLLEHYKEDQMDVLLKNNFGRSALTEGFGSDNADVANLLLSHDSATEEKLLMGTSSASTDAHDPMDVDDPERESHVHDFTFGAAASTPCRLSVRELPMANADDPFGNTPAEDTTGYAIWAASLVMAQWMASMPPQRFDQKNVLELGAGCGVPGLAVAKSSQAANVIITDLNPTTVDNLRTNVGLNDCGATAVTAAIIDWDDVSTYPVEKMDIVIGSDLIYQKSIVPYLKKVVLGLLKEGQGRFLYVAPDTGRDGLSEFIESMKRDGFQLESQQVAPREYHSNPLTNGDEEECYVHFHELASSTYILYEFARTSS
jgi:hypothetical protein